MSTPIYERRVVCDNCGRNVSQQRIDAATFDRLVRDSEPDEDDLFQDDQEKPIQVMVTRVPVCSHCQDRT
jgi:hypothetical protein